MQNIIKNNGIDMVYAILVNRKNPYNAKDYEKFKYINIKSTDNREIIVENITYQHFLELKDEMEKEKVIIGIKHALRDKIEQQSLYEQFCIKYGKDYGTVTKINKDKTSFVTCLLHPSHQGYFAADHILCYFCTSACPVQTFHTFSHDFSPF